MRPPRPLQPWELQRAADEYVAPTLKPEDKEGVRIAYGRSLYSAHYEWREDQSAYLTEDDQHAYFDKIASLARRHFRDSQDEEIQMLRANQFALDHDERFREIASAMHFRRYKSITPEEKALYLLVSRFRSLKPEEVRGIGAKETAAGVDLLPPKQRNLFKRWEKNKYRGNWFEITMKIIDLAEEGFFDENEKIDLLKRAHALKDKVNEQRTNKKKNLPEDVREGDNLIQLTLEQLFPSIKDLEGDERKKELQKILGIIDEGKS